MDRGKSPEMDVNELLIKGTKGNQERERGRLASPEGTEKGGKDVLLQGTMEGMRSR